MSSADDARRRASREVADDMKLRICIGARPSSQGEAGATARTRDGPFPSEAKSRGRLRGFCAVRLTEIRAILLSRRYGPGIGTHAEQLVELVAGSKDDPFRLAV